MPEGHTIHRYARKHREALGGLRVKAWSPQGRYTAGARRIDGRRLEDVDAHGKHLFYRWEGGETLHVHMGLFGKFRLHRGEAPAPTDGTRLALTGGDVSLYLSGPTICELIDPATEEGIRARLGPDPLGNGADPDPGNRFGANLSRRRISIGAALLDQRVVAGIGNVYRAEILFLTGIDPAVPANELSPGHVEELWSAGVSQLERGERAGRIVTVEPSDVGARRRRDLNRDERLYVYKRQGEPCRRCGTLISRTEMGNRSIWWCPQCQPPGGGR